jgi:Cof subfamily protein (haloacid dehalogenase superfamily)
MFKLIFIDIDGTLLTSDHQISAGTLSAIKRVSETNRVPVILTTARPPQAVEKIYSGLNLVAPVVCFNGALIIDKAGKENFSVLQSIAIDTAFLDTIHNIASDYRISVSFYKNEEWFSGNNDDWIQQEEQITGTKATISDANTLIQKCKTGNEGPHKILLMGEPGEISAAEPLLKESTGNHLNIYKSKPSYLEIMNGAASKTSAMQFLLSKYCLTNNEVLAIGDNFNDIEMLQYAGIGIAMGNAPEEVKAHAGFITLDNDSEGIKFALDKFIQ